MRLEPDSPQRTGEQRRYFPDYTRRLLEIHEELEADRNSYLAGGYAEEFGYRAEPGSSRGVPVLDGESPEQYAGWLGRAVALHPGYPLRPHPIDEQNVVAALSEATRQAHYDVGQRGTFVRVTERAYEHQRHRTASRAAAALTRFLAVFVALNWQLTHMQRRHR